MLKYSNRSLLPVLVLLAAIIASCGTVETADTEATTAISDTGTDTSSEKPLPELPEDDFDGYNFRVAHWDMPDWPMRACVDIVGENNGDTISDAVYRRNLAVCERYNFEISLISVRWDELKGMVTNAVMAGDDAFDLVILRMYEGKDLLTTGQLVDFHSIPYIDLTAPWWDSNCSDNLTIDGKLYYAASDLTIEDKNATSAILFNKKIADDYGVEDLYSLVRSGEWTIERMMNIYSEVTSDLDGDGELGENDIWGFLGGNDVGSAFFLGGGGKYLSKDGSGVFYDSFNTERNIELSQLIQRLMSDSDNFYNHHTGAQKVPITDDTEYRNLFASGAGLFYWDRLDAVSDLRSLDTDFGILPTPKYDAEQENYINQVSHHTMGLLSVPATQTDLERTGEVIEAMCYYSQQYVVPAFIDNAVMNKTIRDDDSGEMIELVFDTMEYDIALIFNWGGIQGTVTGMKSKSGQSYASVYEASKAAILAAVDETTEELKNR